MKILHIISSLKIGGAEIALCNLLEKLSHQKFEHHVAYFHNGPCEQKLRDLGIRTYPIQGLLHRYDFRAFWQLNQLIKQIDPDIIHSSLWAANVMGRMLAWHHKLPIICDLHGNSKDEGKIRNMFDRLTLPLATNVIAVADSVYDAYKEHIIGSRVHLLYKLIVIKNGIDARTLRTKAAEISLTRTDLGIPKNAFVIGSVGRLELIKSYDVLLQAFALLYNKSNDLQRPLVLCLVGDGSQADYLKKLARGLGVSHAVIFMGSQANAYHYNRLFDCFALSSQSEGLSLALLEALCFSLPIVTTHTTPKHDVITHNVHGFLVPPNNPQILADYLHKLYYNSELAQSMQRANAELIGASFDLEGVAQQYAQLYRQLIKSTD